MFKKKLLILIVSLFICIGVVFKLTILDSPDILCKVAEGFDEPSTPFYLAIERIYKLSNKKSFGKKLIQYLENDENKYLHDVYIRILGVIGDSESLYDLKRLYIKYQHNKEYKATLYYIIRSMGLIGDKEIVTFLETLLTQYKELHVQVSESNIVTALYLITGRNDYYFTNSLGERQKLYLTNELIEAMKAIEKSKGRARTIEEMITLDMLYRRP